MTALSSALTFVWLGLIIGISFIEAPLKFRAPEITVLRALGIGRLVFRALNRVEIVLALTLAALWLVRDSTTAQTAVLALLLAILAGQIGMLRPRLNRRTDHLLAGGVAQRSRLHVGYIGLEMTKVWLLVTFGVLIAQV